MAVSFEVPEYTANADAIGALRILGQLDFIIYEIKQNFIKRNFRNVWQSNGKPQSEKLPFYTEAPMVLLNFMLIGYCKL